MSEAEGERIAMNEDFSQVDPIEEALVELDAAEKARLFDRTRLSAEVLLRVAAGDERIRPRWLSSRLALPAAAAIALAFGVSAWRFNSQSSPLRMVGPAGRPIVVVDAAPCCGEFFGCLTGPGAAGAPGCGTCDYDDDGDVDLADYGAFQRSCAGPSH